LLDHAGKLGKQTFAAGFRGWSRIGQAVSDNLERVAADGCGRVHGIPPREQDARIMRQPARKRQR
jgi:hypothetical protein